MWSAWASEVQHRDADDQRQHRVCAGGEQPPARKQDHDRGHASSASRARGRRAGPRRRRRGAGNPRQPEQADHRVAVLVRGGAESRNASVVHSALKQPKSSAPSIIRWRRIGSSRTSPGPSAARRRSGSPVGRRHARQPAAAGSAASTSIAAAANTNTVRHPNARAINAADRAGDEDPDQQAAHHRADDAAALARGRERRAHRHDHLRDRRCDADEPERSPEHDTPGAAAAIARPAAVTSSVAQIRPRRSRRSPSGTSSASPTT